MGNYLKDTLKQKFNLSHPEKYFGTKNPICKSSWEFQMFSFMDRHPSVTRWGYECLEVPYFNPSKGKYTVYYPDIYCHIQQPNGEIKQFLLEIKPYKMTLAPIKPSPPKTKTPNSLKKYENSLRRYALDTVAYKVNEAKWQQASAWCKRHNINFMLVTEREMPSFVPPSN